MKTKPKIPYSREELQIIRRLVSDKMKARYKKDLKMKLIP